MTPVAAIAWDIDGTLIDSEPLHLRVLTRVCDRYGLDVRPMPQERFRGVHLPDVFAMLAPMLPPGLTREQWMGDIIDLYVAEADSLEPLPGAREAIALFAARGLRQVCVSNSNRRIVDANIRALGIADRIVFSISLDDVGAGKPDPEPYRRACLALGLDPASVVAVEDSATGAASAAAAGLRVVGLDLTGGTLPGADMTIAALDALPACIAAMPAPPHPMPTAPVGV